MAALTPLPIPPTSKASHPSSAPERALFLKTAKALALTIPPDVLAIADDVIE